MRITKSVGRTGERWGPKGKRTEQGVEARAVRDALAHLGRLMADGVPESTARRICKRVWADGSAE